MKLKGKPSGKQSAIRNPLSERIISPGFKMSSTEDARNSSLSVVDPGFKASDTLAIVPFGRTDTRNLIV